MGLSQKFETAREKYKSEGLRALARHIGNLVR